MPDIRKQVLAFAKQANGTRVWAQTHRINKTHMLPIESTYTLKNGTVVSCRERVTAWKDDEETVLSDTSPFNDLSEQEEVIRTGCNIGYGECWDLAYAALQANKGLTRVSDYSGKERKWSSKTLSDLTKVTGGEILEIKPNTYFIRLLHGAKYEFSSDSISPKAPHTAIVKGATPGTGTVEVYEQNTTQGNKRNMLVHTGNYGLMNKVYKNKSNEVLQLCGGNQVKKLSAKVKKAFGKKGKEFDKSLSSVIKEMKAYIKRNNKLTKNVKIYVPQSE